VLGLARHWLALFNTVVALFVMLPIAAPVLMSGGAVAPARLIYAIYSPTCHQLPERSWFLFGPEGSYSVEELVEMGAMPPSLSEAKRLTLRFVGTAVTGYKVAICQRDVAIYSAIVLAGLAFGFIRGGPGTGRARRSSPLGKLPIWAFALFLAPMAVDGVSQLIGLRESSGLLRTITGVLFGAGIVWLAYPWVEDSMRGVIERESRSHSERNAQGEIGQNRPTGL
jgi:uncharacterized membrane protein